MTNTTHLRGLIEAERVAAKGFAVGQTTLDAWRGEVQIMNAAVRAAVPAILDELDALREQIDTLANFIMAEVPGEPSQSEGAVECAIRIIRATLKQGTPT